MASGLYVRESNMNERTLDALRRLHESMLTTESAFSADTIAYAVLPALARPRSGNHHQGNVQRQMSLATRVTPSLTSLRKRGLVDFGPREDGRSGTAYYLTVQGVLTAERLRAEREGER